MNNLLKNTALAKELADVLLDDAVTGSLLRTRNISFSFNGNCELTITDETPIAVESDNLAEIADSEAND